MKQRIQFLLLPFLLIATIIFSCNQESNLHEVGEPTHKTTGEEGLIVWTGEIAVDGCEYMLVIEDHLYKPLNLPTSFEIDSLKVVVKYEITQQGYQCGLSALPKTTVNLTEILKKN